MTAEPIQVRAKPGTPIILQSVDKVNDYWKRLPNTEAKALLYGVLTRVTKAGGIVFLVLTDGTGSIQLIAKENDFSNDDWGRVKAQKVQARVQINGFLGESDKKRLSVFLKEVPCELRELQDKGLTLAWPNIKVVSSQMLLSRIRKHCTNYLEQNGFLEIEPFYVSRSWQSDGLHPLVIYARVRRSRKPAQQKLGGCAN